MVIVTFWGINLVRAINRDVLGLLFLKVYGSCALCVSSVVKMLLTSAPAGQGIHHQIMNTLSFCERMNVKIKCTNYIFVFNV